MSKHITQIVCSYTGEVFDEFETEEWNTPQMITFYSMTRPFPTMMVDRWVDDDYVLDPVVLADDDMLWDSPLVPLYQRQFEELFNNGLVEHDVALQAEDVF